MLDIVIRGGVVVDGTGAPGWRGDVGVADGRIAVIGDLAGVEAGRVIDATDRVVCPGFVDVHTHYDAQLFWDNALTPSCFHGVTSMFAGNCGFTIAPLSGRADDTAYLLNMLSRVEGMPASALELGVPWTWQSTGEYLAAVEANGVALNIGFSAGHSTIRRVVMGPAAIERTATTDELDTMQRLLRESLEAGAIGFTTTRARSHNDADGRPVPSRVADPAEVIALAGVLRDFEGTSLEIVPHVGPVFPQEIVELLAAMSAAAQRPLNWNILRMDADTIDSCYGKLAASDYAKARGGRVVALAATLTPDRRASFAAGFGLDSIPGWEQAMFLPIPDKIALLKDPTGRARLNELAQRPDNPSLSFADWHAQKIFDVVSPENEQYRGRFLGEIATEQHRDPWDVLCDIAIADNLLTSFGRSGNQETDADWKARVESWRDPRVVVGASDAGAHLDQIAAFMYPTDLLQRAVREQQILPLEEAIHLLTQIPAELYGLRQRGTLTPGWWADINIINPTTIGPTPIELRVDLPGNHSRLYCQANGIDHTLVNGTPTINNGNLTTNRPGKVLRAGTDTTTPSMD